MKERVSKLLPRGPRNEDGKAETPTISTFHSLCVRILRQHIEALGYKKNFVIYDESEQLGAIKKILSGISAKGEKTDPKVNMRPIMSSMCRKRPRCWLPLLMSCRCNC
jgi:superfamily I DNA/RNA helicase